MSLDEQSDTGTLVEQRAERMGERLVASRSAARQATARADRWRRVSTVLVPIVAGLALLAAAAAVGIAIDSSTTRAGDVVREVTPTVTREVIRDSRAQRADEARRALADKNAELSSRGLPVVADPGNSATADEVVGAWITARVLAALPPSVTDELAAQVADGRQPRVIPSAVSPVATDPGDITVTILPEGDGAGPSPPRRAPRPGRGDSSDTGPAPARPAPQRPGTATRAPAPPAATRPAPPAPAPQPRGGLLRPCLLGRVLC